MPGTALLPGNTPAIDPTTIAFAADLLAAMPGAAAILNRHRELLAANTAFMRRFAGPGDGDCTGMRPGDILQCVNPGPGNGGCGTTPGCSACGLLHALVKAAGGHMDESTCAIVRAGGQPVLDLAVRTRPLDVGGERYLVVSIIA